MVDNIRWLPQTYGPALRAFYEGLMKEPLPQRFIDLVAKLEAEAAQAGTPPVASRGDQAAPPPQERQPEPTE